MKYGIFELLEDPEESRKDLRTLQEEALPRGWEECEKPRDVQKIVANMSGEGFVLVSNVLAGDSGKSGGDHGSNWGRALYFKKKVQS